MSVDRLFGSQRALLDPPRHDVVDRGGQYAMTDVRTTVATLGAATHDCLAVKALPLMTWRRYPKGYQAMHDRIICCPLPVILLPRLEGTG